MDGRINAERDCQQISQQNRPDVQADRHRQPVENQFGHRAAGVDRGRSSEVAPGDLFQPEPEADQNRFVEVQFLAHRGVAGERALRSVERAAGRIAAEHAAPGRVARRETQQHVADQQDRQQREKGQDQPFDDVLNHVPSPSVPPGAGPSRAGSRRAGTGCRAARCRFRCIRRASPPARPAAARESW